MNAYMVEVTLTPVIDGDWAALRRMTDVIPGTILIEDAEEPMLVLPVEAESPRKAAMFMEGVASVAGLQIVRGAIADPPPVDFDVPEDDDNQAPDMADGFNPRWLVDA